MLGGAKDITCSMVKLIRTIRAIGFYRKAARLMLMKSTLQSVPISLTKST